MSGTGRTNIVQSRMPECYALSKTDTRWSWTIRETVTQQLSGPPTLKCGPTSDALIVLWQELSTSQPCIKGFPPVRMGSCIGAGGSSQVVFLELGGRSNELKA